MYDFRKLIPPGEKLSDCPDVKSHDDTCDSFFRRLVGERYLIRPSGITHEKTGVGLPSGEIPISVLDSLAITMLLHELSVQYTCRLCYGYKNFQNKKW